VQLLLVQLLLVQLLLVQLLLVQLLLVQLLLVQLLLLQLLLVQLRLHPQYPCAILQYVAVAYHGGALTRLALNAERAMAHACRVPRRRTSTNQQPEREQLAVLGGEIFSPVSSSPDLELLIVMVGCPMLMNMIQFWIQDNFLKTESEEGEQFQHMPGQIELTATVAAAKEPVAETLTPAQLQQAAAI
jgi:hypothetical protein